MSPKLLLGCAIWRVVETGSIESRIVDFNIDEMQLSAAIVEAIDIGLPIFIGRGRFAHEPWRRRNLPWRTL